MARFRKKPIEVEAVQFVGLAPHADGMFAEFNEQTLWLQAGLELGGKARGLGQVERGAVYMFGGSLGVVTANGGTVMIQAGDWLVRGEAGDLHVCDQARFAAIYEEVAK